MLLLVMEIAVVVGGLCHDKSATRLCTQACCAGVNLDCSPVMTAPDGMDIDIIDWMYQ